MIHVSVDNLSISNVGFVVLLKGEHDPRTLPIFIGVPEAQAIAARLNNIELPRPMTHDLLKTMLDMLEGRIDRVEVYDLQDSTFFGRLILSNQGQDMAVDSRPSDAIAIALRCSAPIYVANEVMDRAGIVLNDSEQTSAEAAAADNAASEPAAAQPESDILTKLRNALEKAIKDECYEEAARLRDEINRATSSN